MASMKKISLALAFAAVCGGALSGCGQVETNEVACFRTWGNVDCGPIIDKTAQDKNGNDVKVKGYQYYGPGLKFYFWPFTTMDTIQISQRLTDQHTVKLTMGKQNQPAEVDYQLLVNVPKDGMVVGSNKTYIDSPYHLMYEIGKVGSGDVESIVDRIIDAGLNQAFAPMEPDTLSDQRDQIIESVSIKVGDDLGRLGVKMDSDIKVSRAELGGAWKEAANTRVISIGKKQAADNEAEATKSKGRGEGDAILEKATKQSLATSAVADADAAYISKMRTAFGGDNNALAVFLMTKSGTALPQVMGTNGIQIVPALKAPGASPQP